MINRRKVLWMILAISAFILAQISVAWGADMYKAVVKFDNVKTVYINASQGSDYCDSEIQAALLSAKTDPQIKSGNKQLKIVVPAGKYKLNKTLKVYSNTWIQADKNAHIYRDTAPDKNGALLSTSPGNGDAYSGYNGMSNIRISGGIWDGRGKAYTKATSNMYFVHGRNIEVRNCKITNNCGAHHLEVGGVSGLTVENCSFYGYNYSAAGVKEKEAIQLDITSNENILPGSKVYDDTPCCNVYIAGNDFHDLSRGIGTHSAVTGTYMSNITITGNKFTDMRNFSIYAYNYKNCIISKNTMKNVGVAIDIRSMSPSEKRNYYVPNRPRGKVLVNQNIQITNNYISSRGKNMNSTDAAAVSLYGRKMRKSSAIVPAGDYPMSGYVIKNNTIKSDTKGIILKGTKTGNISGNDIKASGVAIEVTDNFPEASTIVFSNKLQSLGRDAVTVANAKGVKLRRLKINKAGNNGVKISGNSKVSVYKCTIMQNGGNGIRAEKGSSIKVYGSRISGNKYSGVMAVGKVEGSITRSSLNSNGNNGIWSSAVTLRIANNNIKTNKKAGTAIFNKNGKDIVKNNIFRDNGRYEVYNANKKYSVKVGDKIKKARVKKIKKYSRLRVYAKAGSSVKLKKRGKTIGKGTILKKRNVYIVKFKKQKKGTKLIVFITDGAKNKISKGITVK